MLAVAGFVVGAASIVMLGASLAEEHPKHIVWPITIASALIGGGIAGWCLNYFFHFAQRQ